MAKKVVITSIAIMFLSLFCGICFAAEDNMKMDVNDLGKNINESLDKAGQEVKNVTNDVMSRNMMEKAKDGLDEADRRTKEGINDVKNTAKAGMYNITRTDVDVTDTSTSSMDSSVLVWTIVAVMAVLTISVVWYYVAQNNERKY